MGYERPHPNTKQPQKFTNLVGVIPGKDRSLPPILVGAHYDSVIDSPFDTEMRMLRKAIGPALPLAMKYFKIPMPKSRQELNGLIDEKLHGIPHKPE